MSLSYIDSNGNERAISGLNGLSGEMVMGASTIRKGRVSTPELEAGGGRSVTVTFSEPMPDNDYMLDLQFNSNTYAGLIFIDEGTKTKNGFNYYIKAPSDSSIQDGYMSYTAFKLFSVEGLEDMENDISNLKTTKQDILTFDTIPTANSGNPVTSNGILTALNNKQNTLQYTYGNAVIYNSNYLRLASGDYIKYAKYGRIATVSMEVNYGKSTVNLPANKVLTLATGLPAVANGMLANFSCDTQATREGISYTLGNRFWVDGYGSLCFFIPENAWTGSLHGTVTYIAT
jgi:hypothetical protein